MSYPAAPPYEPLDEAEMEVDGQRWARDPLRDPFTLAVTQIFMGPHELQLFDQNHSVLTFRYSEIKEEGLEAQFFVKDVYGRPREVPVSAKYLDGITVVPPIPNTNFTGAVSLRLEPDCARATSDKLAMTEYIREKYNRSCPDLESSIEHLVFVLKPMSPINTQLYIQQTADGRPLSNVYKTWQHLAEKMTWVAMIRWDDSQQSGREEGNRRYNARFYEEVNFEAWYILMSKIGLQMGVAADRPRTIVYSHFSAFKDPKKHLSSSLPPKPPIWNNVQVQMLKDLGYHGNGYNLDSATTIFQTARMPTPSQPYDPGNYAVPVVPVPVEPKKQMPPPVKKIRKGEAVFINLDDDDCEASTSNHSVASSAELNTKLIAEATTLTTYPPGRLAVTVLFSDMQRIVPGEMLNDSIIEFYLRYLISNEHRLQFKAAEKLYVFSTYLFSKLTDKPTKGYLRNNTVKSLEKRKLWLKENYKTIEKWTRTVDIFSQDLLIFPIHYEQHWYGVFIRHPSKALRPKEEEGKPPANPEDSAQVFIMDSFYQPDVCVMRENIGWILREYLEMVFQTKRAQYGGRVFSREHVREVEIRNLPQQNNLVDCGCFLLTFAENFVAHNPKVENFSTDFDKWCSGFDEKVNFMRVKIRSVVQNLAGTQRWQQFRSFEKDTIVETFETIGREARRPRRHSSTVLGRPRKARPKRSQSLTRE